MALGQTEKFARAFVERLGYLQRLRQAGTLRAAGPFEDLREGMYLCTAADEHEADAYWKKILCIVPDQSRVNLRYGAGSLLFNHRTPISHVQKMSAFW